MEKFLRSQQTYQKFEKVKPELLEDLHQIVASVEALKLKIVDLTKKKEGAD